MDPKSPARFLRAEGLIGLGKFAEARGALNDLLAENPGNEAALYQMGTLNEAEGKLKDAETAYRKSFEANPQNVRRALAS